MAADLEFQVMRKVAWRLVPLLSVGYLINVLDRFNISFAALTMNKALGLSATAYGLGAGAFFWSYVLFQVPANMVLRAHRRPPLDHGDHVVLGRCARPATPGHRRHQLRHRPLPAGYRRGRLLPRRRLLHDLLVPVPPPRQGDGRVLRDWRLGRHHRRPDRGQSAPAGRHARHRRLAVDLPGRGRAGGAARLLPVPMLLRDRPAEAAWLKTDERAWLESEAAGGARRGAGRPPAVHPSHPQPAIVLLMLVYVLVGFGVYGKAYFLPLMIKSLGYATLPVGYITSMPAIAGVIGMVDLLAPLRPHRRARMASGRALPAGRHRPAAGGGVTEHQPGAGDCRASSLASFGISGSLPVFWNLPTAFLGTAAAAGGIALINSVGNISGYVAPQMVGLLRDTSGGYQIPMLVMGVLVLLSGMLVPLAARAAGLRGQRLQLEPETT